MDIGGIIVVAERQKMKQNFLLDLKKFAATLANKITQNDEWTIRGFVDVFRNIYALSTDTKVISKILEMHLFPNFLSFAEQAGYKLELASKQNWYPDLTFISKIAPDVKFAVDLKTTYRDDICPDFCNGFTLGSHGLYFIDRDSAKNVQYPYGEYSGHFCLGVIYSRSELKNFDETKSYSIDEVALIPSVIRDLVFFAEEKWKIASDKQGSGNTANIGSIQYIDDILAGNGVFSKAGEDLFDNYWANYGKIEVLNKNGAHKKLSSFAEYLRYRGLPESLNNPRKSRKSQKICE